MVVVGAVDDRNAPNARMCRLAIGERLDGSAAQHGMTVVTGRDPRRDSITETTMAQLTSDYRTGPKQNITENTPHV